MLKRILSASIGVVATIVALAIYWMIFMPWLHLVPLRNEPWLKLAVAIIALALAIYIFARQRSWAALFFLVGSIPVVLVNVEMGGWLWRMNRVYSASPLPDDPRLAFLFPGDDEHSPVNTVLHYLVYLSMLCLTIAFSSYISRVVDRHLTKR